MIVSLPHENIELHRELEIILIISESACVDNLVSKFKKKKVESDIYWIKDPMQLAHYVESTGSYRGKQITEKPKIFILDGRFGTDSYEFVSKKINANKELNDAPLYVLSRGLTPLEREIFACKEIQMIDDSLLEQFHAEPQSPIKFYE